MKKKLKETHEFEVMKLVLDKFLWVAFVMMALGLYVLIMVPAALLKGTLLLVSGAIMMLLFLIILYRHYEIGK